MHDLPARKTVCLFAKAGEAGNGGKLAPHMATPVHPPQEHGAQWTFCVPAFTIA